MATELRRDTGAELVVVTIPGVGAQQDRAQQDRFATKLFNFWGIGDCQKNNGVLILVSTGDRRVEVEIGRGLNRVFNREEWLKGMIHSRMTPFLRRNLYNEGLIEGVAACCQKVVESDREVSSPQGWRQCATLLWGTSGLSLLAVGILLGHGRLRRPPSCSSCGARMTRLRLAQKEELEDGQQAEMELGSVKHILCGCGRPGCQKLWASTGVRSFGGAQRMGGAVNRSREVVLSPEEVLEATRKRKTLGIFEDVPWLSRFQRCQACGYRTAMAQATMVVPATTITPGYKEVSTECFFCSAVFTDRTFLPVRPVLRFSPGVGSSDSSSFGGGDSSGGGAGDDF